MNKNIFLAKVTLLPCKEADDCEYKTVELGRVLLSNKWRQKVEAVRAAEGLKQKRLKDALPCFTPSGTFEHVCATGLLEHSGYINIDLDAKDNTDIADFDRLKEKISAVPFVAYCGLSCRGAGYSLMIPIADPDKHREYFAALQADFSACGLTIDPSCIDVSRKRFVSIDPEPYINTAAKVYTYTLPERKPDTPAAVRQVAPDPVTTAKLEKLTKEIEAGQVDITASYWDWVRILAALANYLGEDGREYAHRLSQYYNGYDPAATDAKFTNLLQHPEYSFKIGTLFYIARQELGKHDFDNVE